MDNGKPKIAFIGFGEAGQAIAAGFHDADAAQMSARDILFPDAAGNKLRRTADASGVRCAISAADAVQNAEIVISAVTAASSGEAAQSVTAHLRGKPFFLDINSVSPGRKQDTAKMLGAAARYIDVAVLAPIHPARHQTPLLIAGLDSQAVAPALTGLGMRASIAGVEIGAAAGDQNGAQRHDQGYRGADAGVFFGRGARRGHRRSRSVHAEQLPRPGLGEGRSLQLGTNGGSR